MTVEFNKKSKLLKDFSKIDLEIGDRIITLEEKNGSVFLSQDNEKPFIVIPVIKDKINCETCQIKKDYENIEQIQFSLFRQYILAIIITILSCILIFLILREYNYL